MAMAMGGGDEGPKITRKNEPEEYVHAPSPSAAPHCGGNLGTVQGLRGERGGAAGRGGGVVLP